MFCCLSLFHLSGTQSSLQRPLIHPLRSACLNGRTSWAARLAERRGGNRSRVLWLQQRWDSAGDWLMGAFRLAKRSWACEHNEYPIPQVTTGSARTILLKLRYMYEQICSQSDIFYESWFIKRLLFIASSKQDGVETSLKGICFWQLIHSQTGNTMLAPEVPMTSFFVVMAAILVVFWGHFCQDGAVLEGFTLSSSQWMEWPHPVSLIHPWK